MCLVALRKESVDRNIKGSPYLQIGRVALRKESVDRNTLQNFIDPLKNVALRKESVDRNYSHAGKLFNLFSRSPQGERG